MASTFRLFSRVQYLVAPLPNTTRPARAFGWCRKVQSTGSPAFLRCQSTAAAAAAPKPSERTAKTASLGENEDEVSFGSLKGIICYDTLKAITVKPFKLTTMTPVQAAVLPLLPGLIEPYNPSPSEGDPPPAARDLLVKAKTGTGKTLAFLVPAVEARLNAIEAAGKKAVRDAGLASEKNLAARARRTFTRTQVGTLIISPTRELATQIANEALRLAHHHNDFEVRLLTGGASKRMQMRDWMKGRRDIVVATPGRLLDLLHSEPEVKNGISKTHMLILDEADTLLDMGFRDDIEAIKEFLPPSPERQTFLFSATVSRQIQQVARSTLDRNHLFINTVSDNESPVHAHVPQFHTVLPSAGDQIPHILRLIAHDQLTSPGKSKIILFLPTTKLTQLFATLLRELCKTSLPSLRETRVYEIHSKRAQESRMATSDAFRQDKSGASILVTSDVSARGVDYPSVTRVIQLGIPSGTEQYIHRIGRTGRAGTGGRGDLVLLPWEVGFLSWQMDGVPLKPLTTNELKSQLNTLAEAYDADPAAAFKGVTLRAPSKNSTRSDRNKPTAYPTGQKRILEGIPAAVDGILPSLDEEALKETFASMLGYYLSKSPELRVQKSVIVEGCKDWTTGACGLPVPPYVSESFLQRLGFSDGRTKRFGRSYGVDRQSSPSWGARGARWEGRGRQRSKDRVKDLPVWARSSGNLDEDDPIRNPEEHRTARYNARPFRPREKSPYSRGSSSWTDDDEEAPPSFGGRRNSSSGEDVRRRERDRSYGSSEPVFTGRRPREQGNRFGLRH